MKTEIIAVGTELLLGQIANTNAQFLSSELAAAGFHVYHHTAVGDNSQRLRSVMEHAASRSDCIILTGGLGPTKDDLTKETAAEYIGTTLAYHAESLEAIIEHYKKTGKEMSENNKKQALVIEGSFVLPNDKGMAPGMIACHDGKVWMLLPGPPSEMKHMFQTYGLPKLLETGRREPVKSRVLRFFGIGESMLETKIADLIEHQSNPTIAPLAGEHEVTLRLSARFSIDAEAKKALDEAEKKILERVGEFYYGHGESTLEAMLLESLIQSSATVSAAESLTGGWFGKALTDAAGASKAFSGSAVVYNNEMKQRMLGVKPETLEQFGAVSPECAAEMAEGIRSLTGTSYGISFTGAAGPDSDGSAAPGTVYVGIASSAGTKVLSLQLAGSRSRIRALTVKHGMFALWQMVKKGQ
ncbi:competence/damage-inducible protein A [Fictibacillus aquaticus]|uniref:Putative competence-damage inducible protein n=1 Tax=Fictibacillus aquaticus TaxID=2021314 RepID=A0A235FC65_9BACL|nr:competence/damage-inducible protein A [Fictibacillus aquaticus]OYD58789.1 competence/damage-inducible protein A [Fictibacillus aquaticus]